MSEIAFHSVGKEHQLVDKFASFAASSCVQYNRKVAGGKILKGLQNRRNDERALFLGA